MKRVAIWLRCMRRDANARYGSRSRGRLANTGQGLGKAGSIQIGRIYITVLYGLFRTSKVLKSK